MKRAMTLRNTNAASTLGPPLIRSSPDWVRVDPRGYVSSWICSGMRLDEPATMCRTAVVLLSVVALAACKQREPSTVVAVANVGPVSTTPKDLFDDFTRPSTDGLALLDKYRDGATFTGTVKTVGVEESGKPVVMIDVDGNNIISLDFLDPSPVNAKALKAGDTLTVTCKIGGASGALMMVTDCPQKTCWVTSVENLGMQKLGELGE